MSFVTVYFLMGVIFAPYGCALLLWRYFRQRSTSSSGRQWKTTPYPASLSLMIVGLVFVAMGAMSATSEDPPAVVLFLGGLAVGCCIATAGLVLAVRTWPSVVRMEADRGTISPPWRPVLGATLLIVGLVGGGVIVPLTVLLTR